MCGERGEKGRVKWMEREGGCVFVREREREGGRESEGRKERERGCKRATRTTMYDRR